MRPRFLALGEGEKCIEKKKGEKKLAVEEGGGFLSDPVTSCLSGRIVQGKYRQYSDIVDRTPALGKSSARWIPRNNALSRQGQGTIKKRSPHCDLVRQNKQRRGVDRSARKEREAGC